MITSVAGFIISQIPSHCDRDWLKFRRLF